MKKPFNFLVYWLLSSLILYFANLYYPTKFVLGNHMLSLSWSAVIVGGLWTAIVSNTESLLKFVGVTTSNNPMMFVYFWGANIASLWLIARFSLILGFGVVSFTWVAALALAANIIQYLVGKFITK